jgi:hypothetical protein
MQDFDGQVWTTDLIYIKVYKMETICTTTLSHLLQNAVFIIPYNTDFWLGMRRVYTGYWDWYKTGTRLVLLPQVPIRSVTCTRLILPQEPVPVQWGPCYQCWYPAQAPKALNQGHAFNCSQCKKYIACIFFFFPCLPLLGLSTFSSKEIDAKP